MYMYSRKHHLKTDKSRYQNLSSENYHSGPGNWAFMLDEQVVAESVTQM